MKDLNTPPPNRFDRPDRFRLSTREAMGFSGITRNAFRYCIDKGVVVPLTANGIDEDERKLQKWGRNQVEALQLAYSLNMNGTTLAKVANVATEGFESLVDSAYLEAAAAMRRNRRLIKAIVNQKRQSERFCAAGAVGFSAEAAGSTGAAGAAGVAGGGAAGASAARVATGGSAAAGGAGAAGATGAAGAAGVAGGFSARDFSTGGFYIRYLPQRWMALIPVSEGHVTALHRNSYIEKALALKEIIEIVGWSRALSPEAVHSVSADKESETRFAAYELTSPPMPMVTEGIIVDGGCYRGVKGAGKLRCDGLRCQECARFGRWPSSKEEAAWRNAGAAGEVLDRAVLADELAEPYPVGIWHPYTDELLRKRRAEANGAGAADAAADGAGSNAASGAEGGAGSSAGVASGEGNAAGTEGSSDAKSGTARDANDGAGKTSSSDMKTSSGKVSTGAYRRKILPAGRPRLMPLEDRLPLGVVACELPAGFYLCRQGSYRNEEAILQRLVGALSVIPQRPMSTEDEVRIATEAMRRNEEASLEGQPGPFIEPFAAPRDFGDPTMFGFTKPILQGDFSKLVLPTATAFPPEDGYLIIQANIPTEVQSADAQFEFQVLLDAQSALEAPFPDSPPTC